MGEIMSCLIGGSLCINGCAQSVIAWPQRSQLRRLPLPAATTKQQVSPAAGCCKVSDIVTAKYNHFNVVIMSAMASPITSLTIANSAVYSGADQRKHQNSASLAFVRGIHRSPVNFLAQMASNAENVSIWWRHQDHRRLRWEVLYGPIQFASFLCALKPTSTVSFQYKDSIWPV